MYPLRSSEGTLLLFRSDLFGLETIESDGVVDCYPIGSIGGPTVNFRFIQMMKTRENDRQIFDKMPICVDRLPSELSAYLYVIRIQEPTDRVPFPTF